MFKQYLQHFICLMLLLICATAWGTPNYSIENQSGNTYTVGEGLEYLEDSKHLFTFADIQARQQGWQKNDAAVFNQGYSASTWWLRFRLENIGGKADYTMEISYAVLDYLDVYVVRDNDQVKHFKMGDKLPFKSRPIDHRLFSLPFQMNANENVVVFIKVKSSSSIQVPIKIREIQSFYIDHILETAMHAIFMGGIFSIAMYNLLIYFALKDRSYLYYVGYVLSMFLFLASLNGWSFQFLWPNSTTWNDTSILMSLNGVVIFAIIFSRRFLRLDKLNKHLTTSAKGWVALSLACFLLFLTTPYSVGIRIIIPFAALACLWALAVGVYAWYRGQRSASIYVLAWSGLWIGGIVLALNKMQIIPRNTFTDYAVQMGSLLEVLLLSFALAERINHERSLRLSAQNLTLKVQKKANEELEARVEERTKALEEANKQLQELSDTDQLTKLKNRRYLNNYLENEFKRAQRYQHTFSLLLIDVDHFKSVNDQYGHLAGDDCLHEVANRISKQLRWPTDLAARYGGEEFCVVLPETPTAGAITVAKRIREEIDKHIIVTNSADLKISVSIGVCSKVPTQENTVIQLLDCADKVLYKAKQNGRNRVEVYEG